MTASPVSSEGRLTEERLRTWLDGNQPARERMCLQILALDRRYTGVKPRQPKGGPDGGYDLEATFQGTQRAVGGIGFRNSASDDDDDRRWAKSKFEKDLKGAIASAGSFAVFVFMTNVRLTVTDKEALRELAQTKGVAAEVLDRENLRLALDSSEGYATRFAFLQIPLSYEEQTSFFARWGSDLEALVTKSFGHVEARLRRLEFMHEKTAPIETLGFLFRLREPVTIADQGHIRAVLSLSKLFSSASTSFHIGVGVCNNAPVRHIDGCGRGPCLHRLVWYEEATESEQPEKIVGSGTSTRPEPLSVVGSTGNLFFEVGEAITLNNLGDAFFAFFANESLARRIVAIEVFANEYLLWSASEPDIRIDAPNGEVSTPWKFSEEELSDSWVRIMTKKGTPSLNFSSATPRRMWDAPAI